MKQCSKCKQWLTISEFHKDRTTKDKLEHRCKQCRKVNSRIYYLEYKKSIKDYQQTHEKQINKYLRSRRKTNLKYNIKCKMRKSIWKSLHGSKNDKKWQYLVGYTADNLIKHLKKTMPKNYTWDDYLSGKLHIDHIIPISVFNFTKPEHADFKRCWALSNLRLLPAKENSRKHNRMTKPLQLALRI